MIDLDSINALGFDVDHTLAKYNIPHMFNVIHDALTSFLVEQRDWDKRLLASFDKDKEFCSGGIIADNILGNFLKVGENGQILRACHGMKPMTEEDILDVYGKSWHATDKLFQNVNSITSTFSDGDYMLFDNYFDSIGMIAYGRMIDIADEKVEKNGGQLISYKYIHNDLLAAYNHVYRYEAFAEDTGGFFPLYKKDTKQFIEVLSDEYKSWLRKLRLSGKIVFAMTSSHVDFASHTLNYILGSDWKTYFDVVLTRARKPGFFTGDQKFKLVELKNAKFIEKEVGEIQSGCTYTAGNLTDLMKYITTITQEANPKILYVGDSMKSDIFPSKKIAGWKTLLILKESDADEHDNFISSLDWGPILSYDISLSSDDNSSANVKSIWSRLVDTYADGVITDVTKMIKLHPM